MSMQKPGGAGKDSDGPSVCLGRGGPEVEPSPCEPGQLTLHADRGSAPASKTVAQLLADLGVERSHSRPHVSNDNPFSESQFATVKGHPEFPDRFGCLQHARRFCGPFFG